MPEHIFRKVHKDVLAYGRASPWGNEADADQIEGKSLMNQEKGAREG